MQGKRLLVADDDNEMRSWLRAVLERLGAQVEEARSGWEALFLLSEAGPYDLVITDVRMPMPHGVGVVSMARSAGVVTPFIIITAFGDDELRKQVERLADVQLLDKPFDVRDLLGRAGALMARTTVAPS